MKWNAALDGSRTPSVRAIADEIMAEERSVAAGGLRKGVVSRFFTPKPKVTRSVSESDAAGISTVPAEGDNFATLIHKVMARKKARDAERQRTPEEADDGARHDSGEGSKQKIPRTEDAGGKRIGPLQGMEIENPTAVRRTPAGIFDVDAGYFIEPPSPPSIPNSPPSSPEGDEEPSSSQVERELHAIHWKDEALNSDGEAEGVAPAVSPAVDISTKKAAIFVVSAPGKCEHSQMKDITNTSPQLEESRLKKRKRPSPAEIPCGQSAGGMESVANGNSPQAPQSMSHPKNLAAHESSQVRLCTPPTQKQGNNCMKTNSLAPRQSLVRQSEMHSGLFVNPPHYGSGLVLSQSPIVGSADTQLIQSQPKTPLSEEQRRRIEQNKQLAIEKKKQFLERRRLRQMRQPDI